MRKLRQLKNGAKYKILAIINKFEMALKKDEMKELFMRSLKEAKTNYKFKVLHFCIMGNHIHLIVEPVDEENLSRIMQWLLGTFAVRFNKIHRIRGHVWYDRFRSKILDSIRNLLLTFSYISEFPVKKGVVKLAEDFLFSGVIGYRNRNFEILDESGLVLFLKLYH